MGGFDEIKDRGNWSEYFQAKYDPESYEYNMALSERQLFTQSNARVLLGQDNMGRMHFLAVPHEKDYAIPTRKTGRHQHITACPGMFYQTDLTLFLGKAFYQIETDGGEIIRNGQEESVTRYLKDFLPWTETVYAGIHMDTFSIAPVLEHPCRPGMKTLPLPGPSGAVYGMRIKNECNTSLKGKVRFLFADLFMSKYEHCGDPVETRAYPSQYQQVDRNLLLMQRPEGYTGIYMKDGFWKKENGNYTGELELSLLPGEEMIVETYLAVSETPDGISEAMSLLFMQDALTWVQITDEFWKKHLGTLTVKINGEDALADMSRDMHIRNILDDFNCIQTDENGRVLVHWQGAPSHCMGRMWGIDVEPTTLSFIHMFPEMSERLIEYMIDRNEPRYTEFPEHSTPIMMAPLVMAGEYFDYTGNESYFRENPYVLKRLDEIWDTIRGFCKEGYFLIPSRYSSDGIVMRRYDHGTNVKFWYASCGYAKICEALGRDKYKEVVTYAENLKKDIQTLMVVEGPFGKQISGGTNLDEQGDFYMDENFSYYDGEDSSSVLAPVYGIYDFTYEPWVNYHRYARSLFCCNYDPEMDTLRWFPYGGALDGTAYVSQLGGSLTKPEMRKSLDNMIRSAVDQTGSLYWWPKAENMRRMIARCSQGQGSWIVQYLKQWLGIRIDAANKILKIQPMGLLDGFEWKNAFLGGFVFDISYQESENGSSIQVINHNQETFTVVFGCRSYGTGAEGNVKEVCEPVAAEMKAVLEVCPDQAVQGRYFRTEEQELECFADEDGIMLQHFGFRQPYLESVDKKNVFLLRLVLGNKNEQELKDVKVQFKFPSCMKMGEKELRLWGKAENFQYDCCTVEREFLGAGEKTVIPVWVELNREYDADNVWFDGHPFFDSKKRRDGELLLASETSELMDEIAVRLEYVLAGKPGEKELIIPVKAVKSEQLQSYAATFLGALSE